MKYLIRALIFNKAWKRGLLIFTCFYLSSCISEYKDYPSEWSPIVTNTKKRCPDISGKYSKEDKINMDLASYLSDQILNIFETQWPSLPQYSIVEFNLISQKELKISIWLHGQEILSKVLLKKKGDFSCKGNFIILQSAGEFKSASIVMGGSYGRTKTCFTKSSDDFLIMRVDEKVAAVIFLVMPFGMAYRYWHRFKAIDD